MSEETRAMFTSVRLQEGQIYTRENLRELFQITDQTLFTGIFRPARHDSIWLFITEQKSPDRTQYIDHLDGDMLSWQGQTQGLKDQLIIDHKAHNLELLVFYRKPKSVYSGAGFRNEGQRLAWAQALPVAAALAGQLRGPAYCGETEPQAAPQQARLRATPASQRGSPLFRPFLLGALYREHPDNSTDLTRFCLSGCSH
jgi:putative restriction endonuclease